MSAAPLKLTGLSGVLTLVAALRAHMSAAPLKLHEVGGRGDDGAHSALT